MKTRTFPLMTLLGAILLFSCGSSDDSLLKQQETTTTAQVEIVLPTTTQVEIAFPADQISALVYSYIASTIQNRPNQLKATNPGQLMECVNSAAMDLGKSLLPTFATPELANTAIMQQVQQNLEKFIAQCSTN